jgi:hypothetical protein
MFKKFNPTEKSMLIVVVALVVILIIKSFFFDEVRGLSGDERYVHEFTKYSVAQKNNGLLQQYHILIYRVFDIYMADPKVTTVLHYDDPQTGESVERWVEGRYNAQVRTYFLGIIPVGRFSVQAPTLEENSGQRPESEESVTPLPQSEESITPLPQS